jgi:hypothetical protein
MKMKMSYKKSDKLKKKSYGKSMGDDYKKGDYKKGDYKKSDMKGKK